METAQLLSNDGSWLIICGNKLCLASLCAGMDRFSLLGFWAPHKDSSHCQVSALDYSVQRSVIVAIRTTITVRKIKAGCNKFDVFCIQSACAANQSSCPPQLVPLFRSERPGCRTNRPSLSKHSGLRGTARRCVYFLSISCSALWAAKAQDVSKDLEPKHTFNKFNL